MVETSSSRPSSNSYDAAASHEKQLQVQVGVMKKTGRIFSDSAFSVAGAGLEPATFGL